MPTRHIGRQVHCMHMLDSSKLGFAGLYGLHLGRIVSMRIVGPHSPSTARVMPFPQGPYGVATADPYRVKIRTPMSSAKKAATNLRLAKPLSVLCNSPGMMHSCKYVKVVRPQHRPISGIHPQRDNPLKSAGLVRYFRNTLRTICRARVKTLICLQHTPGGASVTQCYE